MELFLIHIHYRESVLLEDRHEKITKVSLRSRIAEWVFNYIR